MRVTRQHIATSVASLVMLGSLGCSSMSPSTQPRSKSASLAERLPWIGEKNQEDDEVPYPNPVKLAATWTPDTLMQTGRVPTRGFGGRLFFYDEKSRPVPVEGTLVVHGFDEEMDDPQKNVKRFEFTPEQFTRHFSKSDMGASYSVWIPWDAVGGDKKRISLVASFKTPEGKAVQGVPTMVILPGKQKPQSKEEQLSKFSPQYLQYQKALAMDGSTKQTGLTTTTITRRRRRFPKHDQPNEASPSTLQPVLDNNMIAGAAKTPSLEISMNSRPGSPDIRPASAEIPSDKDSNGKSTVRQSY